MHLRHMPDLSCALPVTSNKTQAEVGDVVLSLYLKKKGHERPSGSVVAPEQKNRSCILSWLLITNHAGVSDIQQTPVPDTKQITLYSCPAY